MAIFRRSKKEPPAAEPPEPAAGAAASAPVAAPHADSETGLEGPVSVLVVDDDEDVRFVITTALARDGFDVVGDAGTAEEALMLAAKHPEVDIVLLDLHMPDMGGLELMPLLRERTPEAKFVVCSAITASYMLEATMDAGATGFIVKGVSAKSIGEHLRRVAKSGLFKIVRPYPLNRDY